LPKAGIETAMMSGFNHTTPRGRERAQFFQCQTEPVDEHLPVVLAQGGAHARPSNRFPTSAGGSNVRQDARYWVIKLREEATGLGTADDGTGPRG
jgi:hypothetical protein